MLSQYWKSRFKRPLACFDFDSWGDAIDFAQVCLANGHKVVLGKE